jgi:hypothetical protein
MQTCVRKGEAGTGAQIEPAAQSTWTVGSEDRQARATVVQE